jgi:hypothetical protein
MPLINLRTDLKSLRYGKDRRGGGSSNQPYIKSPIPKGEGPGLGDEDFLLRGGSLTPVAIANDVSRLSQMFFDFKSPNGLLFTAKQQSLSKSAVNILAGRENTNLPLNNGAYLPTSTLAQAASLPFGGHLLKQGLDPTANTSEANSSGILGGILSSLTGNSNPLGNPIYFDSNAYKEKTLNSTESRLVSFFNTKINTKTPSTELYRYSGGPGSDLGVGNTIISLSKERTGVNNLRFSTSFITPDNRSPKVKKDFREKNPNSARSIDYTSFDKRFEGRVNLGDPGKRKNLRAGYSNGLGEPLDKINAFSLYKSEYVTQDKEVNDFVKFRIGVIDNNDPSKKTFIHFRALIDEMSDNYQADWNATKFAGRGENLYNYQGFDRSISLGWTVAAQSKQELMLMYQKLNYLASSCAPDYSSDGYMRGNLISLTVGGYLYEQVGIMKGINYTVPTESPWEIAINENGESDENVKEMPHIIRVSGFQFIPIHNFVPSIQNNGYGSSLSPSPDSNGKVRNFGEERYISLTNGDTQNYTTNGRGTSFTPPSKRLIEVLDNNELNKSLETRSDFVINQPKPEPLPFLNGQSDTLIS